MGPILTKIHANSLAKYRKTYFDINGDEYEGTIDGRLIFIRSRNRSETSNSRTSSVSGNTTNTSNLLITEVIDDNDKFTQFIELQSEILTELKILNHQIQNLNNSSFDDPDSLRNDYTI